MFGFLDAPLRLPPVGLLEERGPKVFTGPFDVNMSMVRSKAGAGNRPRP